MFTSCDLTGDDDSGSGNAGSVKPIHVVFVGADDSYWNSDLDSTILANNVELEGFAVGSPVPSVSGVTINGQSLLDFEIDQEEICFYAGELITNTNTGSVEVNISTNFGNVTGSAVIPALSDKITSHKNEDTIVTNQALTITWRSTAPQYFLYIRIYDDNYNDLNSIDTILTGVTSFTVPASMVVPGTQEVSIGLTGYSGAYAGIPGATANMAGTGGVGFLLAENAIADSGHVELNVKSGTSKSLANLAKKPVNRAERIMAIRKAQREKIVSSISANYYPEISR
jgi:hypothetical protein